MSKNKTKPAYDIYGIIAQKDANPLFFKKHIELIEGVAFSNKMLDELGPLILSDHSYEYTIEEKDMPKFRHRPKVFSFSIYRSVEMFHVILYLNEMTCAEEFNRRTLIIPHQRVMIMIAKWVKNENK